MPSTPSPDVRPGRRRQPPARRPGRRRPTASRRGGAARAASSRRWSRSCGAARAPGSAGPASPATRPSRSTRTTCTCAPVAAVRARRSRDYYEGFSNDTLWPIYHDVIVPATFHRRLVDGLPRRSTAGSPRRSPRSPPRARTVWVHDYQLQLVPAMVRELRPGRADRLVQPHPVPAGRAVRPAAVAARRWSRGCSAPTSSASSAPPTPRTSCAPAAGCSACRPRATPSRSPRRRGAQPRRCARAPIPISVDFRGPGGARRSARGHRARPARSASRSATPRCCMLGVDRLDYTKGIRHRLKAYEELLARRRDRAARRDARAGGDAEPRARRGLPPAARARSR